MSKVKNLESIIRKHIGVEKLKPSVSSKSRRNYHEMFDASGIDKATEVLEILTDLDVDLSKSVVLSVGGSTGSEIIWLLENSNIRHGVLMEFDPEVAPLVSKEIAKLKKKGKELVYMPGDVTQTADACRSLIQCLCRKHGLESVICTAHAVFHELPTRSPDFHPGSFLTKLLKGWPRTVFIAREPCTPTSWPARVELQIEDFPESVLKELAEEINRHLQFSDTIRIVGNATEMSSSLAIETLIKFFYAKDLQHELEERVTGLVPTEFIAELEKSLGDLSVSHTLLNSKSFEKHYRELKVIARNPDGRKPLTLPLVFCQFIGDSQKSISSAGPRKASAELPVITSTHRSHKPEAGATRRFLRRRCRIISNGTQPFKTIMHSLLSRQIAREKAVGKFEDTWESLKRPHEKIIAHAAYLEYMGRTEEMLRVLQQQRFAGSFENVRKLFEAIAHEKLDDTRNAKRLLKTILETEKRHDILRAAQFNLHVCYEKSSDLTNAKFDSFMGDKSIICPDGERLSDKAVAMQLILCMETNQAFTYKNLLNESLDYLRDKSDAGYAKTLLMKLAYEQGTISAREATKVLAGENTLDENSRTAIMVQISHYLPKQEERLRQSVVDRIITNSSHSESVKKWTRNDPNIGTNPTNEQS